MKSSKLKLASIVLAVVLCLLVLSAPAGAVVQPNRDFYVLDNENVLSAETEKYIIDRNLNLVSNCKGAQVCVVVTDSTNGQHERAGYRGICNGALQRLGHRQQDRGQRRADSVPDG